MEVTWEKSKFPSVDFMILSRNMYLKTGLIRSRLKTGLKRGISVYVSVAINCVALDALLSNISLQLRNDLQNF